MKIQGKHQLLINWQINRLNTLIFLLVLIICYSCDDSKTNEKIYERAVLFHELADIKENMTILDCDSDWSWFNRYNRLGMTSKSINSKCANLEFVTFDNSDSIGRLIYYKDSVFHVFKIDTMINFDDVNYITE